MCRHKRRQLTVSNIHILLSLSTATAVILVDGGPEQRDEEEPATEEDDEEAATAHRALCVGTLWVATSSSSFGSAELHKRCRSCKRGRKGV